MFKYLHCIKKEKGKGKRKKEKIVKLNDEFAFPGKILPDPRITAWLRNLITV